MRLLIYSHDTFGLGHLRRCRAIAHSLVESRPDLSVLLLSGSPIIGSFGFRTRVDYVRFPGVVKLHNGGYTAQGLDISIEDAIAIRRTIIRSSAEAFNPHIFLVDKEPLGLRGEVEDTLNVLKSSGAKLVLGLRDILDDEELLREEWDRKGAMSALDDLYDDVWIYGRPEVFDPLAGLDVPSSVRKKITYTGYLRRQSSRVADQTESEGIEEPYILVTTGGGGDGAALVDWVLRAYEQDPSIPQNAMIVYGPFMHHDVQFDFAQRVERLKRVHAIPFTSNLEQLMINSSGVVAMGGYNTICEILSFDKPSLIVPRTTPRLEQYIRVLKMQNMGLLKMLVDDDSLNPQAMASAIHALADQAAPLTVSPPGLLDGLANINSALQPAPYADTHLRPVLHVVANE